MQKRKYYTIKYSREIKTKWISCTVNARSFAQSRVRYVCTCVCVHKESVEQARNRQKRTTERITKSPLESSSYKNRRLSYLGKEEGKFVGRNDYQHALWLGKRKVLFEK